MCVFISVCGWVGGWRDTHCTVKLLAFWPHPMCMFLCFVCVCVCVCARALYSHARVSEQGVCVCVCVCVCVYPRASVKLLACDRKQTFELLSIEANFRRSTSKRASRVVYTHTYTHTHTHTHRQTGYRDLAAVS